MGILISRLRRKKSSLEILESLEKEIKLIEEYGQTTERQHKAVVGRLLLFSVGLYVLAACLFYFFFFPASLYDQLLYVVPLLLFPLIIFCVKRLVSWWYRRRLSQYQGKLSDVKKQKKELLEEVMDKETYKIAKQILEKFAPDQLRRGNAAVLSGPLVPSANTQANHSDQIVPSQQNVQRMQGLPVGSPGTEMRRRLNALPSAEHISHHPVSPITTPHLPPHLAAYSGRLIARESTSVTSTLPVAASIDTHPNGETKSSGSVAVATSTTPATTAVTPANDTEDEDVENNDDNLSGKDSSSDAEVTDTKREKHMEEGPCEGSNPPGPVSAPTLMRPILPRDRTMMDRLVEYLVGDGVNQRYALICRNCHSHNGMALKDEFEYLAFRCCYCLQWNPAHKQRPQAPRFEALQSSENYTSSPSESNTDEDEDKSAEPASVVSTPEIRETKSEPGDCMISSSSSDEDPAASAETAESPSTTDAEFESLIPGPSFPIPTNEDVVSSQ